MVGEDDAAVIEPGEPIGPYVARTGCDPESWAPTCVASDGRREVAITLLAPNLDPTTTAAAKIEAALRDQLGLLGRLAHPGIRPHGGFGWHRGYLWIAAYPVDGAAACDHVRATRPTGAEPVELVHQVCDALAAAHEAGLPATDVSMADVVIGVDGRALVDLPRALAATILRRERPTDRMLWRSPLDTAPECWEGQPWTPRAVVFSICAGAWRLLFGAHPFEGGSVVEVAAATLADRRRPLAGDAAVPAWITRELERGLARDPGARPPSLRALATALARRGG